MKTIVKWPGNKTRIVDQIERLLPNGKRLMEPFAGSAAVFLNTSYDDNIVNDRNADLINMYVVLKELGSVFIDMCRALFTVQSNTPDMYYSLRDEFNHTNDSTRKAALFLYLNRHGYNGLVRYNADGGYNVPFGRYKKPYFPFQELQHFYVKSQAASFLTLDFEEVMRTAKPGDIVYCDPPYVPLSTTANFTNYSAGGFGLDEHIRLAKVSRELSCQGIPVLISNHNNEFTREIYAGAVISEFEVQRFISCDGDNRTKAPELLALFDGRCANVG